LTKVLWYCN